MLNSLTPSSYLITTTQKALEIILNPFELYTLPLENWINSSVNFIVDNYRPFFQIIRLPISWILEGIQANLLAIPPLIFLIFIGLISWQLAGRKIALYSIFALSLIGFFGAWKQAIVSLSLVMTAVTFCIVIGITIGLISASNQKVEKWLQPFLDAMQTLPSFVYLVPVVMLFGIGEVSGVIATFIFAVPPLIRLTNLGIRQVSTEIVEAAYAFGSTPKQILWEVQIPLALPTILTGVNQAIMLALSMSVVTSMIGVEGLGGMVLQGLGRVNVGLAAVGGLSIVLIAIMLDRMTQVLGKTNNQLSWQKRGPIGFVISKWKVKKLTWATFIVGILLSLFLGLINVQKNVQKNIQVTLKPTEKITEKAMPGQGITIKSGYSGLQEERFQTEIVNIGLEKLGYKIPEPKQIEYTALHIAVGNGDLDYIPLHWDKGHKTFFEKGGGEQKLAQVGVLIPHVWQGYQIDKKTADKYKITSITQLKDPKIAKLFDSDGDGKANLTGCNSGWFCEFVIDYHINAYGLQDTVKQDRGSYTALMADTITRYKQGKPVLYYTWTPMWIGAVLKPGKDVTWLDVPFTALPKDLKNLTAKDTTVNGKNLGFPFDRVRILANKKFLAANPAAKRWFELIQIPVEDINAQNQLLQEGQDSPEDIHRHVKQWIENHQPMFDTWIEDARKAGIEKQR